MTSGARFVPQGRTRIALVRHASRAPRASPQRRAAPCASRARLACFQTRRAPCCAPLAQVGTCALRMAPLRRRCVACVLLAGLRVCLVGCIRGPVSCGFATADVVIRNCFYLLPALLSVYKHFVSLPWGNSWCGILGLVMCSSFCLSGSHSFWISSSAL